MYVKSKQNDRFKFFLKQTQFNPDGETRIFVRNVGVRPEDCTVSQPIRLINYRRRRFKPYTPDN
jgi:hypothetical protein